MAIDLQSGRITSRKRRRLPVLRIFLVLVVVGTIILLFYEMVMPSKNKKQEVIYPSLASLAADYPRYDWARSDTMLSTDSFIIFKTALQETDSLGASDTTLVGLRKSWDAKTVAYSWGDSLRVTAQVQMSKKGTSALLRKLGWEEAVVK